MDLKCLAKIIDDPDFKMGSIAWGEYGFESIKCDGWACVLQTERIYWANLLILMRELVFNRLIYSKLQLYNIRAQGKI